MKKIFTLLFSLIVGVGSVWADFGIGVGATCTQVQMKATTTSPSCSTYQVKIFAINPYSGAEAAIAVAQSVTMNSATSIKGNHSFTVTSGTSSWFVNEFTSSTGGRYIDPYNSYYPLSGTFTFTFKSYDEENGWPIYTVNLTNGTGVYGNTYYTGGTLDNIVDLPVKVYKNDNSTRITLTDYYKLTVNTNNASYGTVSGGGYYASGASRTITATPNSGFRFVQWNDGNTNASRSVTLNSNLTYTATFEPLSSTKYTITVVADNDDYCTVSGSGEYTEGEEITISSTSKNPHLYIFDMFMENDDQDLGEPSFEIEVTGDATYTAYYRLANPGTISATAAHGTVSGTGSYAGGAEVTLGVTADDGYVFTQWSDGNQDNPRTVYVDGNKNYTAQFVQGVAINAENSVLYVWDSDGETPLESGGGSFFDFVCVDGDYTVQIESASTAFSTATFSGSQLEQTANYTYVMYNGNKIALDYSQSTITFTANSEQYSKRKFYDVNATLVATNGTRYVITAKTIRAMDWDSDTDSYDNFPQNDYNFAAPTYTTSLWEYQQSAWSYSANSKWLTADVTISNYIYRIRLAFNVATDYIPTGVYTLATGNGTLLSNYATPTYSYETSSQHWACEIDGSHVFQYGTGNEDYSYWWFLETGTISVVNTNGVYYVEVDALNSRGLPVRFTMGTPPSNNHTVSITAPTNGTITVLDGATPISNGDEVEEGTTLTISAAGNTGYHLTALTVNGNAFTSGNTHTLNDDVTIAATFAANTHNVSWVTDGNALTGTYTNGTVNYGTTIVAPNTPTKNATAQYTYTFNGWSPTPAATVPDNDVTYTATWTETPVNYTLTWEFDGGATATAEGDYTHGTVAYNTNIAAPADPTKTGYTFNGWDSEPAATMPAANTTYTAQWNANAYTVSFNKNGGTGDDMTAQEFTYDVAQNLTANAYTAPENKHFMGWATTAEGDVAYADGAEVSNLTATQNGEVELFAKWAYNTYTVVFNKNNEDATGSMDNQAFTYGTAQNLTTNGFTLSGHDFAGWATEENGAVVYTNGEEVNNLTSVHEGIVNLYAKWTEIFVLRDDKEAGDTYYTTTYANKKAEGKKLNVQYNRSFTAGRWATFALPFGYSFRNRENPTFGGQVYYLISAKYEQRGEDVYLTLNCMPNTTGIEANKPYVLIPNANITNPVFEDVKLKDIAENPYTASDMSGTGTIKFVNTTYRQRIDRADADENLRVIFLKNNTLCYPGGAVTMSAFRGYFYMMDDYTLLHGNQNAPVRVRLMTPDGEYIEQAPDTDQPAAVETKKYIENGILVIERAGMKYDAQGHIIK